MKDQIRSWLDSIRRGFKLAPEDPLDTWVELIHHAAIYSDFLNVVPEPDEVVRSEMVSRLRVLHGGSFDVVTIDAVGGKSWLDLLSILSNNLLDDTVDGESVELSDALLDHTRSRYASGGVLLVVIDNCQHLESDVLNQIGHFSLLSQRCISFVLLGERGFSDVIREGPAQSMKQYISNPMEDTVQVIQHRSLDQGLASVFANYWSKLEARFPQLNSIVHPVKNGSFPLGHTVAITLVVVVVVLAFLSSPMDGSDDIEQISEVTLPEPKTPAMVEFDNLSVAPEADHYQEVPAEKVESVSGEIVKTEPVVPDLQPGVALQEAKDLIEGGALPFFAIQILGVGEEAAARTYIDSLGDDLNLPLGYLKTNLNGSPWYVVLVGRFEEKEVAKKHIQKLPHTLRQSKPWVRFSEHPAVWLRE